MAGIYLHIPFCKQACHYCDFHFSTDTGIRKELLESMKKEIILQQGYLAQEPIETIYFGGGTPSILTDEELSTLLGSIQKKFLVQTNAEITLEANPDDLTLSRLRAMRNIGVNRLSIGIQSFDDDVLTFLNRAHSSIVAASCIPMAREAGFENISLDLIYAIPGQLEDKWRQNIYKAIDLNPEHISAYSLTIEEKTAFGRWAASGKLKAPDDEIAAHQLEILVKELEKAGYQQYEISNFSKPGYESQHNSSYWKEKKYLGIGPSAHSYNLISRQFNVSNNHHYIRSLNDGTIPFEFELLSADDHINEYLLTTLRTSWGCDLEKMKQNFSYDILATHAVFINNLIVKDLAVIDNGFLKLTPSGRLLADKISSDLFLVS